MDLCLVVLPLVLAVSGNITELSNNMLANTTWLDTTLTDTTSLNIITTTTPITNSTTPATTVTIATTTTPITNTTTTTTPITNSTTPATTVTNATTMTTPITNSTTPATNVTNATTMTTPITNSTTPATTVTNTTTMTTPITNSTTPATTVTNVTTTTTPITNSTTPATTVTNATTTTTPITNSTTPATTVTIATTTTTPITNSTTPATTVTNTTITTVTNTTFACLNGGRQATSFGFCLCPDDFTGKACELPNFCNEATVSSLTFPKTVIGQASYSKEQCSPGSINAGLPRATAWCQNETRSFSTPLELNCSLTLDTIDTLLSGNSEAIVILASNTQILTSKPERLTSENISTAAKIANTLLLNNFSNQIHTAVVTTVSQLLNVSRQQFDNITTDSISNLTQTLQQFSLNQSDNGSLIVQPNIAIQSYKVSKSLRVQFTAFSDFNSGNQQNVPSGRNSDTLSANRIKINDTFISDTEQFPVDVQMSVQLKNVSNSAVKASDTSSTRIDIGIVLYNNDQFFRSQLFHPSMDINRKVIAGNLGKQNSLDFVQFTMGNPNISSLRPHNFACVFWDYTKKDWSTNGCEKICHSATAICRCEATTKLANFAMLMSFSSNPEAIEALGLISIIGCVLSVVGLTITVIFQILTRKSRKSSPTILMVSICVSMISVYLLFIFGINNPPLISTTSEENIIPNSDFYQHPDSGLCTVFTALLHYFLLAAFTWNMLYASHIFLLIKNTLSGPPHYFNVLSIVVGWGLPALLVGVSLGVTYRIENPLHYRQEALCWLAALNQNKGFDWMKPMLWSFLLPVAVMLLFNIKVFLYFAYTTCKTDPNLNSSQVTPLKNKMLGCVSMSVVLGLTWVIGYFMLLETKPIMHTILSYAFCICNTTQGIQIFVLFTLRTPIFKEKALAVLKLIPAPVLARHSKKFNLWTSTKTDHEESYRSFDFDNM